MILPKKKHDPHGIGALSPQKLTLGQRVLYWPRLPASEGDVAIDTTTRSDPWELGHGTWVVKVTGIVGGVAVTHLQPVPEETLP